MIYLLRRLRFMAVVWGSLEPAALVPELMLALKGSIKLGVV